MMAGNAIPALRQLVAARATGDPAAILLASLTCPGTAAFGELLYFVVEASGWLAVRLSAKLGSILTLRQVVSTPGFADVGEFLSFGPLTGDVKAELEALDVFCQGRLGLPGITLLRAYHPQVLDWLEGLEQELDGVEPDDETGRKVLDVFTARWRELEARHPDGFG